MISSWRRRGARCLCSASVHMILERQEHQHGDESHDRGKLDEAESTYERTLTGQPGKLGERLPRASMAVKGLAKLRHRQDGIDMDSSHLTDTNRGQRKEPGSKDMVLRNKLSTSGRSNEYSTVNPFYHTVKHKRERAISFLRGVRLTESG